VTRAVPSLGQRPNMGRWRSQANVHLTHVERFATILPWRVTCTFLGTGVRGSGLTKQRAPDKRDYVGGYRKLGALRLTSAAMGLAPRGTSARRLGRVLLMIGGLCCCTLGSLAQTFDSRTTDQSSKPWTATSDLKSNNVNPTRIIESHNQNGNRTLDTRSVLREVGGHFEPYQDIETETLQRDAATICITTRTYGQDSNGKKTLVQVTEEERRTLPGGDSSVLRVTSNPDLDGRLQPVQRDVVETRRIGVDVEETRATVLLLTIDGLAPVLKTDEIRRRTGNDKVAFQETTLLFDGAGNWEVAEKRQGASRQEGNNRSTEERIFQRDHEGNLGEVSRVVSTSSETAFREKSSTAETYSIDVPGTTRDGRMHLVERTSITQRSSAPGEQTTERQAEKLNPGDPASGLRVSVLTSEGLRSGPLGEESTVTIRTRDSNGNFGIVSVDTTKSDRISTIQIEPPPYEQPK
jgi:hypothetical protein